MTIEPRFLTVSEVMEIHDQEIATAGGLSGANPLLNDNNSGEIYFVC